MHIYAYITCHLADLFQPSAMGVDGFDFRGATLRAFHNTNIKSKEEDGPVYLFLNSNCISIYCIPEGTEDTRILTFLIFWVKTHEKNRELQKIEKLPADKCPIIRRTLVVLPRLLGLWWLIFIFRWRRWLWPLPLFPVLVGCPWWWWKILPFSGRLPGIGKGDHRSDQICLEHSGWESVSGHVSG